ncbi:regulatory protein, luxR family [Pseudonocardia thermophila]|uniref:Regulatory protein, luxR family n=1 Tax=Pseudonocardia thermophila TaxID=1848 RepID=A0A1M6QY98_PSETH|nr:LuxR family transcriptional regulator [Pseudonocardia thermophila]SHK25205.1 regulatory protein, luxR family [Pseudonocardia thermophila]
MTAPDGRLFGRDRELAVVRSELERARAGSGGLLLVSGPPGIGKTRLVEELVDRAGDVALAWGAAVDADGMPMLWPWTRAAAALPEVRAALATDVAPVTAGPADAAAAAFAADTGVLDALAAQARAAPPLLVVLEDLHWADAATVRLLERLATEVRRLPVLAVATHRPVDAGPFADALPRLLARSTTVPVTLGPLTAADAAALLSHAVTDADPAAVREAIDRAGGSPLVLWTLTRIAADQLRGRASWDGPLGGAAELGGLVAAALHAAGPATADAVAALSVLGGPADAETLTGLLGAPTPAAATELLAPAVALGLVTMPGATAAFSHALVRDAVYATIPPQRRLDLHRTVAELLEPGAVGRGDRAGTVARHWVRAGEPARAVPWAVRAADDARAGGGYAEAEDYLQLALDARAPEAGADEAELLLDLARVQALAGRPEESVRTSLRAAAVGERSGRPDVVARAAVTVQGYGHPGVNRAVAALCRRALTAPLDPALAARVAAALSCALAEVGDIAEAEEHARQAMAAAVEAGDRAVELDAILAAAMVAQDPRLGIDRAVLGRRSVELAAATGRPLAVLWGHLWLCDAAIQAGDLTAGDEHIAAVGAVAEQTGLPVARWHHLRHRAAVAAMTGNFELARRLSAEARTLTADWNDQSAEGTYLGHAVFLALLRGDPAELPPGWRRLLDDVAGQPFVGRAGMAVALLLDGDTDHARALCAPLVEQLDRTRDMRTLPALDYLCELAIGLRDAAAARRLRAVIDEVFPELVVFGTGTVLYSGAFARTRAELALVCGDTATAAAQFAEAARVNTAIGARPYLARTRDGLARVAHATGDLTGAARHARAAAAAARALDLPGLLRDATALLDRVTAEAAVADPFTPREREIAELVGRARSNRAIAAELVLSERTVESHVRNILMKTGTTSRKEFIRWMLTRGQLVRDPDSGG